MDAFFESIQSIDLSDSLSTKESLDRASRYFHEGERDLSKKEWQKVLVKLEEVIRHTIALKGL